MLKNYFKVALRNLLKSKLHSSINILGLAISLAVAILIMLYVRNEFSYDKWFEKPDQVYRVYRQWAGSSSGGTTWTPSLLAKTLQQDFPEVISASGLSFYGEVLLDYNRNKLYVDNVAVVDSTFFSILPFPFLYGNAGEALSKPNSLVISRDLSERVFGIINPIGKTILLNGEDNYEVRGVMDIPPGNAHIKYDIIIPFTFYSTSWTGNNRATYVRLQDQTDIAQLEEKITAHINKFLEKDFLEIGENPEPDDYPFWKLQPLKDIHLQSATLRFPSTSQGNMKYVYIFSLIGIIILLIAGINYMNFSTAQATQRAKEVGMRKVSGARKEHLIGQFLSESVIQSLIALILAVLLAEFLLPIFNGITDRSLSFLGGNYLPLLSPLIGLTVLVGLLAGSYPAFVLSSFEPAKVLKGTANKLGGKQFLRKGLVVAQFTISIALIIIMTFIFKQVNFMMNQELGFNGEQVVVIPMNLRSSHRKVKSLENEFKNIPGVQSIATSSRVPGQPLPDWTMKIQGKEELKNVNPRIIFVNEGYAETLDLEVVQGRFFSSEFGADTINNFVVNETFVKRFQLEEPIGQGVRFSSDTIFGKIIGVVKDYHYRGLNSPIQPLAIGGRYNKWSTIIKLSAQNIPETIAAIQSVWSKVEPEHPMQHSFLDADFAKQYTEQERFGQTLFYSTLLTIFIAMLGLFGLATFTAQKRIKEIGIRKVLGASVGQVTYMLIKDFVLLVLIAGLVAIPIGFLLTKRWLEDFAYATDISYLPFLGALIAALIIASLTVSYQAIRAATVNPVESLRNE